MTETTSTCDPLIQRETLQVCLYLPRSPQSAFAPALDRTHDRRRPGVASLATKISLHTVFLPPVPQELPGLRRRIIAAISEIDRDVLQRVLAVWRVTKGGHTERLWGVQTKLGKFLFPSVGRVLQSCPAIKCADFMKCVREL